jgi:hypothetical protein
MLILKHMNDSLLTRTPKVYIANPFEYTQEGVTFYHETLLPTLGDYGFLLHQPWEMNSAGKAASIAPYAACRAHTPEIKNVGIVIAVLDKPIIDSFCTLQIGIAIASAKPVFAYCLCDGDTDALGAWLEAKGGGIIHTRNELEDRLQGYSQVQPA